METSGKSLAFNQIASAFLSGAVTTKPLEDFEDILKRSKEVLAALEQGDDLTRFISFEVPDDGVDRLRRIALLLRFDVEALSIATGLGIDEARIEVERLVAVKYLEKCPGEPAIFTRAVGPERNQDERDESSDSGIYTWRDSKFEPFVAWWEVTFDAVNSEWKGDPGKIDEFRKLHAELSDHFGKLAKENSSWLPELLFHQCVTDPARAIDRLAAVVRDCLPQKDENSPGAKPAVHPEAKDGIALASAWDALGAVTRQRAFLPAVQKREFFVRRARVDAWSKWAREWYSTQRYIPRPRVHAWFDDLRKQTSESRLLVLHAPGGSGKTMSLRWLITHHCLPREELVAHLDFDDFVGGSPVRDWQLLLRCAEQINMQLPDRDLDLRIEGIRSYERGESFADSSKRVSAAELPRASDIPVIKSFPQTFGDFLESFSGRIVTIIVDTMEEAMIRSVTGVTDFVATLIRLAQSANNVRIILCGRYPLSHLGFDHQIEHSHPGEWSFYKDHAIQRRLPLFDLEETGDYLRRRGLKLDESQLRELIKACGEPVEDGKLPEGDEPTETECSPFDLSLIASLYDKREGEGEIEHLIKVAAEAQRTYLLERIIDHIGDPLLRWVIRYGAVPRLLTHGFFVAVIVPRLKAESGRSKLDNPATDSLPAHLQGRIFFSSKEKLDDESLAEELWAKLGNFAESGSWVEAAAGNAFRFHPRVRQAMSELLQTNPVLNSIHEIAAHHFAGKAKQSAAKKSSESPHEGIDALREEYYHRFKWKPLQAARHLIETMKELFSDEKFEAAYRLAEDVCSEDYPPLSKARTALIRRAQTLAALDMADTAPSSGRAAWLGESERALQSLRLLYGDSGEVSTGAALLEAMVALRQDRGAGDLVKILSILKGTRTHDPVLRSRVRRAIAMAYEAAGTEECTQLYTALLEERLAEKRVPFSPLSVFLIRCLTTSVRALGGDSTCWKLLGRIKDDLAGEGGREIPDTLHSDLLAAFANLIEGYRRPESSRRLIEDFGRPNMRTPQLDLLCSTGPARDFPERGEGLYQTLTERFQGSPSVAPLGAAMLGEAWTHATRCDADATDEALHRTILHLAKAAPVLAARCHLVRAEYHLFHFHDYAAARQAIADYQRSGQANGDLSTSNGLRERLLHHALEYRSHGTSVLVNEARELLDAASRTQRWSDSLRASLGLMALLQGTLLEELAGEIGSLIIKAFKKIPDPLGRSNLPELLRDRRDPIVQLPAAHRHHLTALLAMDSARKDPLGNASEPSDFAWASLTNANFLRLLGEDELAMELTAKAERHFKTIGSLVGLREAWHLNSLAGWKFVSQRALQPYRDPERASGSLVNVIAVEQAGLCLAAGKAKLARDWMSCISSDSAEELQHGWRARVSEVNAILAKIEDDHDKALRLFREAEARYLDFSDQPAAERVRSYLRALGRAPAQERLIPEMTDALPLISRIDFPGTGVEGKEVMDQFWRIDVPEESPDDPGARSLVSLLAEKPDLIAGSIFEEMTKTLVPLVNPSGVHDLCWSASSEALSAIPWELCRFNRKVRNALNLGTIYRPIASPVGRIRWLQIALNRVAHAGLNVDGVWGLATAAAWAKYRARMGRAASSNALEIKALLREATRAQRPPRRPQAVLLQASSLVEKRSSRGLSIGGSDLPSIYKMAGFDCHVMRGVGMEELPREWFRKDPPDLIHIYSSYLESGSSGILRPDLGNEIAPGKRSRSNKTRRWRFAPPLVILDGPCQPHPHEQARQILLRNAYGDSLAARGTVPNILAIGLDQYPNLELQDRLLRQILRGESLREIYNSIAFAAGLKDFDHLSGRLLHQHTGLLVPALWSCDPDLSVIY